MKLGDLVFIRWKMDTLVLQSKCNDKDEGLIFVPAKFIGTILEFDPQRNRNDVCKMKILYGGYVGWVWSRDFKVIQ